MRIRKYLTTILAVFSILPIVLIMVFSVEFFRRNSAELLQTNVRNVAEQAVENVDQFFSQRKMALEVASDLPQVKQLLACSNLNGTAKDQTLYRNNAIELFKTMTAKQTIKGEGNPQGNYVRRSSLINQRGIVIASDDSSLMGRASFVKMDMRTIPAYGMYISDIIQNQNFMNGQKYFVIAVPVYIDGVYQGFMQSSIDMYYFNTVISRGFMETGSTVIIDSKGNLAGDKNASFVSNTGKIQIDNDFYNQNLKKIDLDNKPNGVISFKVNRNERFGYYSRVAGKDWLILSTIEQAELLSPLYKIFSLYLGVLLILSAALIYIAFLAARRFLNPIRDMSAAFARVEKGDYLTRLPLGYKGEFADMASSFNHLIKKIKEDTDGLKLSEARYALMMEETNQIVFEWDIPNRHIYRTAQWTNKFGFSTEALRPGSNIPNFDQVHRDDQRALADFFRKILEGGQSKPIDVRIKTIQNTYIWCTINMKVLYDENDQPYRAIGLISDTDMHRKMIEKLESKSRTDLLTQLYNKMTTESMIEESLKASPAGQHHGFVIVDIDNFKRINDTLGHIYGDAALKRVSADLKRLFRLTDIVGRVGGDEFMILIKDINSEELNQKLFDICTTFNNAYTGETHQYKISVSVGAAVYPDDGTTLGELYRKADAALYSAKKSGKDRCCLYSDSTLIHTR